MVRFKNRYLLLELSLPSGAESSRVLQSLTPKRLLEAVKNAVESLHGDYGLACVLQSLNVKYLNVLTRVALLRCPRAHHKAVWAAMATITNLQKVPCAIRVLHVGGTIKSCQQFLVLHNKKKLKEMVESTANPAERRRLEARVETILKKDAVPLKV